MLEGSSKNLICVDYNNFIYTAINSYSNDDTLFKYRFGLDFLIDFGR